MAHVLRASIPTESSLEKMATLRDSEGTVVIAPDFSINGTQRRFALRLQIDPESISEPKDDADRLLREAASLGNIRHQNLRGRG